MHKLIAMNNNVRTFRMSGLLKAVCRPTGCLLLLCLLSIAGKAGKQSIAPAAPAANKAPAVNPAKNEKDPTPAPVPSTANKAPDVSPAKNEKDLSPKPPQAQLPAAEQAVPAQLKDCLTFLAQTTKETPDLIKAVTELVSQPAGTEQPTDRGEPSLMVVSYRKQEGKLSDVVVELSYDPMAGGVGVLNKDGDIRNRLGDELFKPADNLLGLLHRDASYFGPQNQAQRQQRAMEAAVNGDMTLLRQQTVEPLHVVVVMPDAGPYLPGSLRSRVQGVVINAELTFGEWRSKVALVTDSEESAEQVGNIVAAWRDMAVTLADSFAGHSSGKPLREALEASSVSVSDNQVITSAAVPAMTVVRVTKEFTGHGVGCPPGPPCPRNKVAVCHKEKGKGSPRFTLCVPPSAVSAHLAHGDTCGPCPPSASPKGNNGVGNGLDPQPPGNPPVNDGPGTGPGNPGRRS